MKEVNIWGFHNSIEHEKEQLKNSYISTGWKKLRDFSKIEPQSRDEFINRVGAF